MLERIVEAKDASEAEKAIAACNSGVLAAPARPDQAVSVTAEMMTTIYALLREEYDFVIVDTPPSFTAEVIATVDAANWICMVCMFDALSLKNTRLGLETVELMGHSPDQIRVVLNRGAVPWVELSRSRIRKAAWGRPRPL